MLGRAAPVSDAEHERWFAGLHGRMAVIPTSTSWAGCGSGRASDKGTNPPHVVDSQNREDDASEAPFVAEHGLSGPHAQPS